MFRANHYLSYFNLKRHSDNNTSCKLMSITITKIQKPYTYRKVKMKVD